MPCRSVGTFLRSVVATHSCSRNQATAVCKSHDRSGVTKPILSRGSLAVSEIKPLSARVKHGRRLSAINFHVIEEASDKFDLTKVEVKRANKSGQPSP